MEIIGSDPMDMKGTKRMEEEEADDRKVKKQKTEDEFDPMIINPGDDDGDSYYGEDSYSYVRDDDEDENQQVGDDVSSAIKSDSDCEGNEIELPPQYYSRLDTSDIKAISWGDWEEGLSTPVLMIEVKGLFEKSYPIDVDEPLPQEFYDARKRNRRVLPDLSKEDYDRKARALARGDVAQGYEDLPEHVHVEIARLALAYFRDTQQNADYEYVRCVKTRASFAPRFGIHMIFIAHPRDDTSTGMLFSVHLFTGDPPKVVHCRILGAVDAKSMYKGKPRHNNEKVPLKRKDVACRYCAQDFIKFKNARLKSQVQ